MLGVRSGAEQTGPKHIAEKLALVHRDESKVPGEPSLQEESEPGGLSRGDYLRPRPAQERLGIRGVDAARDGRMEAEGELEPDDKERKLPRTASTLSQSAHLMARSQSTTAAACFPSLVPATALLQATFSSSGGREREKKGGGGGGMRRAKCQRG